MSASAKYSLYAWFLLVTEPDDYNTTVLKCISFVLHACCCRPAVRYNLLVTKLNNDRCHLSISVVAFIALSSA